MILNERFKNAVRAVLIKLSNKMQRLTFSSLFLPLSFPSLGKEVESALTYYHYNLNYVWPTGHQASVETTYLLKHLQQEHRYIVIFFLLDYQDTESN